MSKRQELERMINKARIGFNASKVFSEEELEFYYIIQKLKQELKQTEVE